MDLYPLLFSDLQRPRLLTTDPLVLDSTKATHRRTQSGDSGVVPALDLKPLQAITLYKWLDSPSKFLCQYEVPGGECRDSTCEDVHPSRVGAVEPTGASFSVLPLWLT